MRGPETKLRTQIIESLKEEFPEGYYFHIHGNMFQLAGIPDIIGCLKGRFLGIEVKCPGKCESKIQAYVRKQIQRAEGICEVVWSVEEALNVARKILRLNMGIKSV